MVGHVLLARTGNEPVDPRRHASLGSAAVEGAGQCCIQCRKAWLMRATRRLVRKQPARCTAVHSGVRRTWAHLSWDVVFVKCACTRNEEEKQLS
jgi:hypothetical protein